MIPKTYGALSPAYQEIAKRMQEIGFGTIRDLPVVLGQPNLKAANVIKRRRLTRPKNTVTFGDDFELRTEHIELFETLAEIENGIVACIEVQYGLPFHVDTVEKVA